jgi:hypothetical protein
MLSQSVLPQRETGLVITTQLRKSQMIPNCFSQVLLLSHQLVAFCALLLQTYRGQFWDSTDLTRRVGSEPTFPGKIGSN